MDYLNNQSNTLFVGQAVKVKGTALYYQVEKYDDSKRIEMPVAENFQAGFCLGLAINGYVPVCMFPRMNFMICATDQIVNHIDKWPLMSQEYGPKVIIKAVVGSQYPLDPGHQHKANYSQAFKSMCDTIKVVELLYPNQIYKEYIDAYNRKESTILIEHADLYTLEVK